MSRLKIKPIRARDTSESHRPSTTLELLFDLVYVIAVAAAAHGFYSRLSEHDLSGFLTFIVAFFILWNAWTSFTWFASGYDPDDWFYRISVMFQMFGSLMIAANIHQFYEQGLTWIGVTGYAIMRLASCSQWWRVYRQVPGHQKVAWRSMVGLLGLQALWISWLFLPAALQTPALFLFILAELLMPVWARSEQFDNWHPGHIAERYGLLTIIVLGEGVVGVSNTIQYFLTHSASAASSIIFLGSSLVALVFSLWWLYFIVPFDRILNKERRRHDLFLFGYGHFFIFASIAGLGSMLNLVTESVAGDNGNVISQTYAMGMLSGMLSVFLLTLTILRELMCRKSSRNMMAILMAFVVIGLSYTAVALGLPITYGIWLIILAPIVMIWFFGRDNEHWLAKDSG
ncbi:low temperature requirement protein A [Psychrobacter sp. F2608]|uniref:Low temperature requirement protein A n=1 Tax=Psychrobacter halodurans TaxID=2818439 RepID=A0AAW4IQU2_9GAMM|nr:low temperature requirement protein A [Psychrobacter halodurans]PJX23630.1 low temperature requirement protein A [Psychrobacter sp. L7]